MKSQQQSVCADRRAQISTHRGNMWMNLRQFRRLSEQAQTKYYMHQILKLVRPVNSPPNPTQLQVIEMAIQHISNLQLALARSSIRNTNERLLLENQRINIEPEQLDNNHNDTRIETVTSPNPMPQQPIRRPLGLSQDVNSTSASNSDPNISTTNNQQPDCS